MLTEQQGATSQNTQNLVLLLIRTCNNAWNIGMF